MVRLLCVLSDSKRRTRREVHSDVADRMKLSGEHRSEVLTPAQGRADNRVGWAASALTRAGAVTRPSRGW